MTINPINGIVGTQAQQSIQKTSAKLTAAIASIVSGNAITSDNVAALSTATELQSQTSGLRQISSNLAQGSSLTQVADGGISQIQSALSQLASLASQASSPALNADNRAALNDQAKLLSSEIDNIANSTSFNGQSLLNGNVSGGSALSLDNLLSADNNGGGAGDVTIGNLSTSSLFGGQSLDLSTASNAQQASNVVGSALNEITSVRASVGSFQQTLDFAAANVDSAINNQEAARSQLADTDFAEASTQVSLADIQQNASLALAAQGNRLNPTLLKLVS